MSIVLDERRQSERSKDNTCDLGNGSKDLGPKVTLANRAGTALKTPSVPLKGGRLGVTFGFEIPIIVDTLGIDLSFDRTPKNLVSFVRQSVVPPLGGLRGALPLGGLRGALLFRFFIFHCLSILLIINLHASPNASHVRDLRQPKPCKGGITQHRA